MEEKRIEQIRVIREAEGPPHGEPRVANDQAETFRRLVAFTSSGYPDSTTGYGRLYLRPKGNREELREMLPVEECCTDLQHMAWRAKGIDGICDAYCTSRWVAKPIPTLKSLRAFLKRTGVHAWFIPPGWACWFPEDFQPEVEQQCWDAFYWPGVWRLRGAGPVGSSRRDGSLSSS